MNYLKSWLIYSSEYYESKLFYIFYENNEWTRENDMSSTNLNYGQS